MKVHDSSDLSHECQPVTSAAVQQYIIAIFCTNLFMDAVDVTQDDRHDNDINDIS